MVGVDSIAAYSCTGGLAAQIGWLGPKVIDRLALYYVHSSNERGELWQFLDNVTSL